MILFVLLTIFCGWTSSLPAYRSLSADWLPKTPIMSAWEPVEHPLWDSQRRGTITQVLFEHGHEPYPCGVQDEHSILSADWYVRNERMHAVNPPYVAHFTDSYETESPWYHGCITVWN